MVVFFQGFRRKIQLAVNYFTTVKRSQPSRFELFTDKARKVVQLATQEAQRLNHEYIGTIHILLALVRVESGVAASVLWVFGIDLKCVRWKVQGLFGDGADMVTMCKLQQTSNATKVFDNAIEEARIFARNEVDTEHLLLGLLRVQESAAAQILLNLGVIYEDVRTEIVKLNKQV